MPAGICEVVRENHGNKFAGRSRDDSTKMAKFWNKSLNDQASVVVGHATVGRLSNNVLSTFQAIWKKMWKKSLNGHATVVGGPATVGRLSNNIFSTFQAIRKNFEKSRWTVTRQWSEVTRPSDDCQKTFICRFKQFGNLKKKVNERSRDSGRRSQDRWMTVKQRFFHVSSNSEDFWKKSLNGHATVVGGQATIDRLSNNVFSTFQAIRRNFEKSRWTVTRQWSEVRRPLADCQTTFFSTFQPFRRNFEKSRWTVTRQWSEVTRPSPDCQTTFFWRFKRFGEILKKVAERSRDSRRTVTRLSPDC